MGAILTIGIPAFKADNTIRRCIASILTQTWVDKCEVIVASDDPNNNYDWLEDLYFDTDLKIRTLDTEENTGPGLARQRCLDACQTPWITFIDADDIFANPLSLENSLKTLFITTAQQSVIEIQAPFLQEIVNPADGSTQFIPRNDLSHPWVFGRIYNVRFLKDNKIRFSDLRAMEDGEFNWKIRMSIEGTPFKINIINEPMYIWKEGSEHSITRTGIDENGIPQYNFDLCPIGATIAAINAAKFCKEANPFNGGITKFIVETMIGQYFTYIECHERKPIFEEQCLFNAKRFYHECYQAVETDVSKTILKRMYTEQYAGRAANLIGIIPFITFFEFMDLIKSTAYDGEIELKAIRAKLPKEIIENDKKTGVSVW